MISFKEYRQSLNEALQKIPRTQYGSNPGGIHIDDDGSEHYVKFPATEEQARAEVATSKLYHKLGITTVHPELVMHEGKMGVKSAWDKNLKSLSKDDLQSMAKDPRHAKTLALMHHAAIITGNRDVVGLDYGNIMHDKVNDRLVSVDQGGSLDHRAMGGHKAFEKNIDDLESFKNPRYTVQHVFGSIEHPEAFTQAKHRLSMLSDDEIDSVMKDHGLEHHSDTIKHRRDALITTGA